MSLAKVKKIEKEIKAATQIDNASKKQLLNVVADLKKELQSLGAVNQVSAEKLAEKAHDSTLHAVKEGEKHPEDLNKDIENLKITVEEFEVSHPKLVRLINRFCMMLSDIGI